MFFKKPDVRGARSSLTESEKSKQRELISDSGLFDAQWYLSRYPDIGRAGQDPLDHFIEHGWREGRDPGPDFSLKSYLSDHPAVGGTGINPLIHSILTPAPSAVVPQKTPAAAAPAQESAATAEAAPAPAPPAPQARPASGHQRIVTKWLDLEYTEVKHQDRVMRFAATGSSSVKRVRSLFTKEPITIAWLDSFKAGESLFDIGANLGMYTIYAAVMRNAKVYAFEPESLNYAELNKNIYLNQLHGRVLAYCLALSDVDKLDRLLLSDFGLGISNHDFEENSWVSDKQFSPDWLASKDNRLEQGCVGMKLDSLISGGMPVPEHIKIDVDGLEHRLVDGMLETLKRPEIRTVLVEINFDNPRNLEAVEKIESLGWRYSWDQLRTHRTVKFTVDQIKSYQERRRGGLNYIFYKEDFYDDYFREIFETYTPKERIKTELLLNRS